MALSFIQSLFLWGSIFAIVRLFSTRRRYKLPPGPKGWPIFGNSFDAPKEFEWLKYQRWSQDYGMCVHRVHPGVFTDVLCYKGSPIISLNLSGTPFIVLNTAKVAQDLMEKRSSLYTDRYVHMFIVSCSSLHVTYRVTGIMLNDLYGRLYPCV